MNFEFIKNAKTLGVVYPSCQNAELLAKSMPNLSIVSARSSAEGIAKLIYGITHMEGFENLSFVDILQDQKVREFYGYGHNVMNAYHYVRRTGNTAVHENKTLSQDLALNILKQLHFVVGETAKRLGLTVGFPAFNADTPTLRMECEGSEAVWQAKMQDIKAEYERKLHEQEKALQEKMEQSIAEEVNRAVRDQTYKEMIKDRVPFDLHNRAHYDIFAKSYVDMHERLVFEKPPRMKTTREFLQKYLYYMASVVSERLDPDTEASDGLDNFMETASILVTCDGCEYRFNRENIFIGDITDEMIDAVNALEHAGFFSIDIRLRGSLRQFYPGGENGAIDENAPFLGYGMAEYLESIRRREDFAYRGLFVYPTHNYESKACCIEHNLSDDPYETGTENILNLAADHRWTGSNVVLIADFDFATHTCIVEALHHAVLDFIPPEEAEATLDIWDEEEHGVLLNGVYFEDADLFKLQAFLDRVNTIIAPIADKCTFSMEQGWYDLDGFGVAYIRCVDQKLMVMGKIFC